MGLSFFVFQLFLTFVLLFLLADGQVHVHDALLNEEAEHLRLLIEKRLMGEESGEKYGNEMETKEVIKLKPVKRIDVLWRKRLKEYKFLVMFFLITGVPLLWTLAALILTDSRNNNKNSKLSDSDNNISWGWDQMVIQSSEEEEEMRATTTKKPPDIEEISSTISLTKDILRVASQSLNLASNTVEFFNILRGEGSSDGGNDHDGGGSGGGGDRVERSSGIRYISKLLRISTTSLGFMLQILNY